MRNPEARLFAEVEDRLTTDNEHHPYIMNRCPLPVGTEAAASMNFLLHDYRRLAVFGSFVLSTNTIAGIASLDESFQDDGRL